MRLPVLARRTIAAAVSRTGSASTSSGTTMLMAIAVLLAPMIETVAKT